MQTSSRPENARRQKVRLSCLSSCDFLFCDNFFVYSRLRQITARPFGLKFLKSLVLRGNHPGQNPLARHRRPGLLLYCLCHCGHLGSKLFNSLLQGLLFLFMNHLLPHGSFFCDYRSGLLRWPSNRGFYFSQHSFSSNGTLFLDYSPRWILTQWRPTPASFLCSILGYFFLGSWHTTNSLTPAFKVKKSFQPIEKYYYT